MRSGAPTSRLASAILAAPILWTIVFLFVPYVLIFTYSFWLKKYPTFEPAFQMGNYAQIVADPQYLQVLLRTAKVAGLTTLVALVLGFL